METRLGFTKIDIAEFEAWLTGIKVARTVLYLQQHHTWDPDYRLFTGANHFELQQSMKRYHISHHGWNNIGQHFTTFPDGSILTGRSLEQSPACIFGFNLHSICIENLGNFDVNKDQMTTAHQDAIVRITAALSKKFNIPVNSNRIVYHHWFDLSTGERNNGTKNNKTCPGTAFFGGNTVADCEKNFLPLIVKKLRSNSAQPVKPILKYVCVNANRLNIRMEANTKSALADHSPALLGSILRVYEVKDGWYRISSSSQHWVKATYTIEVERYQVLVDTLNIRNGPDISYTVIGALKKGAEIFISAEKNGWCNIQNNVQWVKKEYLAKA